MNNASANEKPGNTARVLVVVDIHSQLIASLEVAVAMASARQMALHGMCVDDPDLQQTAVLPFTQEVLLLGGRTRSLENQQLQRCMGRFQERFRSLLAERAHDRSIPWSISTVGGQREVLESRGRTASDLVVVGKPGHARVRGPAPARILVAAQDTAKVLPSLEVLLNLNGNRHHEVLVIAEENASGDQSTQLAQQLAEQLGSHRDTAVKPISKLAALRLCTATSLPLDYVLAASDIHPQTLEQLGRWATCPIIVAS